MSGLEQRFCGSRAWAALARRAILPWAIGREPLAGEGLEVGAGHGAMAAQVLAEHPRLRLTATDVDERMLALARERLAPYGDRARVERADALKLPFKDHSFDVALSFLMLHHVERWEEALAELVRVLKPGGRLLGYDLLDSRVNRLTHDLTRSPGIRLPTMRELSAALAALPLDGVRLRPTRRLVFRISARRA
jgi:ubiquinone/menaquinone biosynthesis C-methylase UbiE